MHYLTNSQVAGEMRFHIAHVRFSLQWRYMSDMVCLLHQWPTSNTEKVSMPWRHHDELTQLSLVRVAYMSRWTGWSLV